jgi:hypothetical protein
VLNGGLMEATGSGGLIIGDAIWNIGTLSANGGNLTVFGNVSGGGKAQIYGTSHLEFKGAASGGVTFENGLHDTGVLILDNGSSFKATVAGFDSDGINSDTIDVENIKFNKPTTDLVSHVSMAASPRRA